MHKAATQLAATASAAVVLSAEAEPAAAVAHLEGVQAELGVLQREAERITGLQRTFQVGPPAQGRAAGLRGPAPAAQQLGP